MGRFGQFFRVELQACAAIILGSLCGCANYVVRPATPPAALTEGGPSYGEAMKYIDQTRNAFDKKLRETDDLQGLTKGGVGGGLTGAAVSAAFGAKPDVVLAFLTAGAVSYSANTATDPVTVGQILNAGLGNLDCIEAAGEQAIVALAGQRQSMRERRNAISIPLAKLQADMAKADPVKHGPLLEEARKTELAAQAVIGTIEYYLTHSPIAGEMIRATRRTIYAVNQELRNRAPSIETIARSGSIIGTFIANGDAVQISARNAAGRIRNPVADGAQNSNDQVADDIVGDLTALKNALATVGSLETPMVSIASVTACHAQFAAATPMALAFAIPVDLQAGSTRELRVVSGATIRPLWTSAVPADVNWNQELGIIKMTAQPTAKNGTYTLRLEDYSGRTSEEFTIIVHAAPAPAADTAQTNGNGGSANNGNGVANGNNEGGPPPPEDD